jgi:hypothetical protein
VQSARQVLRTVFVSRVGSTAQGVFASTERE